jgi:hypothetical protein
MATIQKPTSRETHEALARQVASILGELSGAGRAIQELERRRQTGEDAVIFLHNNTWLVAEVTD